MSSADTGSRVAGAWLALASLLLVASLLFHGPISPDHGVQMRFIAGAPLRWAAAHWGAALSLSMFAIGGLVALTTGSRLARSGPQMSAWAVLTLGALWTMTTAVVEASVIAEAAAKGNRETFETWLALAEGKANGFAFLALAVATIAGNEATTARGATPAWAAWIAAVAGVCAFVGWVIGSWLGIGAGGAVWLISSLVMCVWIFWFGAALALAGAELSAIGRKDAASTAAR